MCQHTNDCSNSDIRGPVSSIDNACQTGATLTAHSFEKQASTLCCLPSIITSGMCQVLWWCVDVSVMSVMTGKIAHCISAPNDMTSD